MHVHGLSMLPKFKLIQERCILLYDRKSTLSSALSVCIVRE